MDKTGRTQGMPLRINPPNKAIIIIIKKEDIGYFETFDVSTSRGAVNKKLRLLSAITNCASNCLAFINFLLKIKVASKCLAFADKEIIGSITGNPKSVCKKTLGFSKNSFASTFAIKDTVFSFAKNLISIFLRKLICKLLFGN